LPYFKIWSFWCTHNKCGLQCLQYNEKNFVNFTSFVLTSFTSKICNEVKLMWLANVPSLHILIFLFNFPIILLIFRGRGSPNF
jgi:hypothetical protein